MNKLEVCVTELDKKVDDAMAYGVKCAANLSLPRIICVEYFKAVIEALEKTDKDVFMDALELYLKEKQGE